MANGLDDPKARRLELSLDNDAEQPLDFAAGLGSKIGDRATRPQSWSFEILRRMEWRRFEILVAAYYRRLGFRVETVDHGPDGGIDATLYEGDAQTPCAILQCKSWEQRVDIKPIRELLGVMTHHGVRRGIFLSISDFTADAKAFATPNRIECIGGPALLARIDSLSGDVQRELLALACEGDWTTPSCPSCGAKTVLRTSKDGRRFWGCASHPRITFALADDADDFTLEEIPDDLHVATPSSSARRQASDRLAAYLIGSLALMGLSFAFVRYALPSFGELASRGAQTLIRDSEKSWSAFQNRLRQGAPAADDSRNAETQKALEERRENAASLAHQEAATREAARKEVAWKTLFQRSAQCSIEENQTRVECVNEYIRARRDFDHRWSSEQP